jgi:hypothetical protein
MAQKRMGISDAHEIISLWKQSGLDKRGFCKERGIAYSRFLYWCRQVKQQESFSGAQPSFITLQLKEASNEGTIRITGSNGLVLQLEANTAYIAFIKALLTH